MSKESLEDKIAIVGMACRFPGADSPGQFWQRLRNAEDCITDLAPDQLRRLGIPTAALTDPEYRWSSGLLADVDCFDARHFAYSPGEARLMDPQHRLFLETSWSALEDAGYAPDSTPGDVGVFAGVSTNKYLLQNLLHNPEVSGLEGWDGGIPPGSTPDTLPSRVAYHLGLNGPTVAVMTACSSALSAICMAADSLLNGSCDMAIAGGVSVELPDYPGYRWQSGGPLSADGRCRPYDARASGSVFGSGVGIVVLKRAEDALADRDRVEALLVGWAMNNDGRNRVGFAAPSVRGQADVVRRALEMADIRPGQLQYIEGHGSGTIVGDPVEVEALRRVFLDSPGQTCVLGSVKGNVGHLDAAAGAAGIIKTVLALRHGFIPATVGFETLNPAIAAMDPLVRVYDVGQAWPAAAVRRAGVSSFGMGGANAHVVLEQPPPVVPGPSRTAEEHHHLLVLSASAEGALDQGASRLREHLEPGADLARVAHALASGRAELRARLAVVARDASDACEALGRSERRQRRGASRPVSVALLFPGVGDEYAGVTAELYRREPAYRSAVDDCVRIASTMLPGDLKDALFPDGVGPTDQAGARVAPARLLRNLRTTEPRGRTVFDQPATFVLEYAMARLLQDWELSFDAMLGHSVGEYVAACLAGVFDLPDVLRLVIERAKSISRLPPGGMLAVPLSEEAVQPLLREGAWLGAVNAPELSVLSGARETLAEVEAELRERGVRSQWVHAEHAYHSPMVAALRDEVAEVVGSVALQRPKLPLLSSVTGTWVRQEEAMSAAYWVEHLCRPVRFLAGLQVLAEDPTRLYLEVGAGQALSGFALSTLTEQPEARQRVVSMMNPMAPTPSSVVSSLDAVGRLWVRGAKIALHRVCRDSGDSKLALPTYAFQRERHWVSRPHRGGGEGTAPITRMAAPTVAEQPSACDRVPGKDGGDNRDRDASAAVGAPPAHNSSTATPTEVERMLMDTWRTVLGYGEDIGLDDDFFELGGHSLLGLQLVNRLWKDHRVDVSFAQIAAHRTVRRIAAAIRDSMASDPAAMRPVHTSTAAPPASTPEIEVEVLAALSAGLARPVSRLELLAPEELDHAMPDILTRLHRALGMPVYPVEIHDHPVPALLAAHLAGPPTGEGARPVAAAFSPTADRSGRLIAAGFVLSAPRSGSTLLRVMLAGHPNLFCPPELHLLGQPTMHTRRQVERGTDRNQGIVRALMELKGLNVADARREAQQYEDRNVLTGEVFADLAELALPRLLVDKSPGNARHLETLFRIADLMSEARFVHLVRSPLAVADSMVRRRFTALMDAGRMDGWEFAEHIWARYNNNIDEFLQSVDPQRRCVITYEDLVTDPETSMRTACAALGVDFHPAVLLPYEGDRMRDGLGDPGFVERSAIDASLAHTAGLVRPPHSLARATRTMAARFGYELS